MHLLINKVHPESGETLAEARCGNLSLHWDLTFRYDQGRLYCLRQRHKAPFRREHQAKDRFLRFRVSESEYERLTADAGKAGCTVSELLRRRMMAALRLPAKTGVGAAPPTPEGLAAWELAHEVRKIGVDLNQLARLLKVLKQPEPPELTALLPQVRLYMQEVIERAGL
jgi:hypothetical protein